MSKPRPHVDSWYAASAEPLPPQAALEGAHRADVCILGGGITGLSTAIELAERGLSVVVLEAERVAWGASGRSGGQVIFGYGADILKIARLVGKDDARRLFDWSREGLRLLRERCAKYAIECDWRDGHAQVPLKPRQVRQLEDWQEVMTRDYGCELQWWERERLRAVLATDRYLGAIFDPSGGHLHPMKYTLGLARAALSLGVRIFEGSRVGLLVRGAKPVLRTAQGSVSCDHAVLAGNAYVQGIAPELDRMIMPVGTYICATEPLGEERARALIGNDMAVSDVNWVLDYFRLSSDHRMLFGGRASYSTAEPRTLPRTLRKRMLRVFPQLADVGLAHVWGGYVDISANRAPHWGRLGSNVWFAQGFSGHGVAATGLAGRVIAEAIRGQSERLDVFARIPHRPFPGGRAFRTPLLVAAMAWYKLRDALW